MIRIKINFLRILITFVKIKNEDFNNEFRDKSISFFASIGNNMNVYIVEVPNETAPSIQGFAKPPA